MVSLCAWHIKDDDGGHVLGEPALRHDVLHVVQLAVQDEGFVVAGQVDGEGGFAGVALVVPDPVDGPVVRAGLLDDVVVVLLPGAELQVHVLLLHGCAGSDELHAAGVLERNGWEVLDGLGESVLL